MELLNPLILFLIISVFANIFLFYLFKSEKDEHDHQKQRADRLNQKNSEHISSHIQHISEINDLKNKLETISKNPSLELTDFLTDQSRYGYSFVRVDPKSVMLRSPRDIT